MILRLSTIEQMIVPAAIILAALIAGILLRKVVLLQLMKSTKRTKWRFDDIVLDALRSSVVLWSLALGLYILIETQGLSQAAVDVSSKGLAVLVIFSITVVVSRICTDMVEYYKTVITGLSSAASLLKNIVRIAVYSVGLLIILDDLHISIVPLLTALGVVGLAIGLGLQGTLSNFFSGLQILAGKQIQVGNYVKLSSGEEGYVEDLNWRATVIRSLAGNHVIIPNTNLANLVVTNYQLPMPDVGIGLEVGVDYRSDLQKVERVTVEVATETQKTVPGAVRDYEPSIRFSRFGESAIYFSVNLRAATFVDQYLIKHEFIKRLKERYDKENISIPFPIRTVYMNKEAD